MTRYRTLGWAFVVASGFVGAAMGGPPLASSASPQGKPVTPEMAILQAMRENPITAPYRFAVKSTGRQYAISGSVGSRQVYDAAVRTLLMLGIPIRDDLTIDTREGDRVASMVPPANTSVPYAYPPPILNRVDDPFYGFEPPLLSYPAWWGAVARRPPLKLGSIDPLSGTANATLAPGSVQLTLDGRGVAILRGVVGSLPEHDELVRKVAEVPGITDVIDEIQVAGQPQPTGEAHPQTSSLVPPPPPTPVTRPIPMPPKPETAPPPIEKPKETPKTDGRAAIPTITDVVAKRVSDAISCRPVLAKLAMKTSTHDGVVTLSGSVPSAYEAMLAYLAVEQTPGVKGVEDRLEFQIPDDDAKNPLLLKGRPEDVERYLSYQVRRQLGDLAHVDRVRVSGDVVEITGTVAGDTDLPRVQAVLRSIPLLRGFRIEPNFHAE